MPGKTVLIVVIFCLVVAGVAAYLYFSVEKPAQDNLESEMYDLYISAMEEDQEIKTGYTIYINGQEYKKGETSRFGAVRERIPSKSYLQIASYNINEQEYYTYTSKEIFTNQSIPYRVDMKLLRPGILEIVDKKGSFPNDDTINLTIYSNGLSKSLISCVKWSFNILEVNLPYPPYEKPEGYTNYDRCYALGKDLENQNEQINITYKLFGLTKFDDYINITIIDRDKTIDGQYFNQVNNTDIGAEDLSFQIIY